MIKRLNTASHLTLKSTDLSAVLSIGRARQCCRRVCWLPWLDDRRRVLRTWWCFRGVPGVSLAKAFHTGVVGIEVLLNHSPAFIVKYRLSTLHNTESDAYTVSMYWCMKVGLWFHGDSRSFHIFSPHYIQAWKVGSSELTNGENKSPELKFGLI